MDHEEEIFNDDGTFIGFVKPKSNFFRLPNNWTNMSARIKALSEMKVIEYVARHTWGFTEEGFDGRPKKITSDEFVSGRKRKDGTRMDKGTGLSEKSVIEGLKRAVEHKFLVEFIDKTDRARIKKSYALKMKSDEEEGTTENGGQPAPDDYSKDKIDSESVPSLLEGSDSTAKNRDLKNLQSTQKNLPGDLKNLQSGQKNLQSWTEESTERTEKETLERNVVNVNETSKKKTKLTQLPDIGYSEEEIEDTADKLVQWLDDPGSRDYYRLTATKIQRQKIDRIKDKLSRAKGIRHMPAVFNSEVEGYADERIGDTTATVSPDQLEITQKMHSNFTTF